MENKTRKENTLSIHRILLAANIFVTLLLATTLGIFLFIISSSEISKYKETLAIFTIFISISIIYIWTLYLYKSDANLKSNHYTNKTKDTDTNSKKKEEKDSHNRTSQIEKYMESLNRNIYNFTQSIEHLNNSKFEQLKAEQLLQHNLIKDIKTQILEIKNNAKRHPLKTEQQSSYNHQVSNFEKHDLSKVSDKPTPSSARPAAWQQMTKTYNMVWQNKDWKSFSATYPTELLKIANTNERNINLRTEPKFKPASKNNSSFMVLKHDSSNYVFPHFDLRLTFAITRPQVERKAELLFSGIYDITYEKITPGTIVVTEPAQMDQKLSKIIKKGKLVLMKEI